jgi:hypothetical protein
MQTDIEVLDLRPKRIHPWNEIESIQIGVIEEDACFESGTISVVFVHFPKGLKSITTTQMCLNDKEVDDLIDGLLKARERMLFLQATK